jgi:hypothetical protein
MFRELLNSPERFAAGNRHVSVQHGFNTAADTILSALHTIAIGAG